MKLLVDIIALLFILLFCILVLGLICFFIIQLFTMSKFLGILMIFSLVIVLGGVWAIERAILKGLFN